METSNVLTDKWFKTPFLNRGFLILQNNIPLCHVKKAQGMKENEDENNADLIVTAVNACKAINPNNPIAVAEVLPAMVRSLALMTQLTKLKYGNLDADIWQEIINAETLYQQATE